jgi:putative tryptophan/tyrosine transport system substrate-binding protein
MKARILSFIMLISVVVISPVAVVGQQPIPVIGYLHFGAAGPFESLTAKFREGLTHTGHVEGRNVVIEYRWAEGRGDRLPSLVNDLVQRQVGVLVAIGPPTALAAKPAATKVPVVFTTGDDPVAVGLVDNLNRPSGNITGIYIFTSVLESKRLELLHQMVPKAKLIGLLANPNNTRAQSQVTDAQEAARRLGLELHVRNAANPTEIEPAIASFAERSIGAMLVGADPFFFNMRDRIITLAARYAIPAIYEWREFATSGGLMSYGTNLGDAYRQAGNYTGRILKGDKTSELPVIQSTKFEFVINLQTARALGIEVPPSLSALADEAIE